MNVKTKQRLELLINEVMMLATFLITGSGLVQHKYLIFGVCLVASIYFYGITMLTAMKYDFKPFFYKWLPVKTKEYYEKKDGEDVICQ